MKMYNILIETSPPKVFFSLVLSVFAGIGYTFLIPVILNSFEAKSSFKPVSEGPAVFLIFEVNNYRFAALFALACLVVLIARTISQLVLSRVAIDTSSKLRQSYYQRMLKSPLSKLEDVGSSKLIASITTDVKTIVQGAVLLPDLLISIVTLSGMLLFLLYLNYDIFVFICQMLLFGILSFFLPIALAKKSFNSAREKIDNLQEAIKGNIYGIKELKLSYDKRNSYLENTLFELETDVRSTNKKGISIMRIASNYGDMVSFFTIGFVAFIFINYHSVTQMELLAAVMVLLYITGPVSVLMNALPSIINANVSLKKVESLFSEIPQEDVNQELVPVDSWDQITLKEVKYTYQGEGGESFSVGPVSMTLKKGEIHFIIGGNGSGKSTLSKLITSHYIADSGALFMGNQAVTNDFITTYRNQIAAIYSDFYLFDRLYGVTANTDSDIVQGYLKKLRIEDKVNLVDGQFDSLSLSDGQRKRVALLVAFLEDKDIYLFDEWAADQDPEFKQVFYYEILPFLKSKNKLVLVVSHDDRYFEVADNLFVMEDGLLREQIVGEAKSA